MKSGSNAKSDAKVFASLSSGLLARKGAARPAMRPQGFGQGGGALEDLGWDDMGFEPPLPSRHRCARRPTPLGEELEAQPIRKRWARSLHSVAGLASMPKCRLLSADEDLTEECY